MRSRFLLPFFSIVLLLGLLTINRSQGRVGVPSSENSFETTALAQAGTAGDMAHALSEKKDSTPGFFRIGRRPQVPVSLSERYPGFACLPEVSFEWKGPDLHRDTVVAGEAGTVFLDRIRILLYPKHSFW